MTDASLRASRSLLLVIAIGLSACQSSTNDDHAALSQASPPASSQAAPTCADTHLAIGSVQGRMGASALLDQIVTVRGIITRQLADGSFYLQEAAAASDADPLTSDALLIKLAQHMALADAVVGSELMVAGKVDEQPHAADLQPGAMAASATILTQALASVCAHAQPLPLQWLEQTVDAQAQEHMLVGLRDWQVAAALRPHSAGADAAAQAGTAGALLVASGHLYQPTQVVTPGPAAQRLAASNQAHALSLQVEGFVAEQAWQMRAGDRFSVNGIVQPDSTGAQLVALEDFQLGKAAVVAPAPQRRDDSVRVLSLNVQNLFNGDGQGGGFPTARGAASQAEYALQLDQLLAAIEQLQPDLLALQELENDGYERTSNIWQLNQALSERLQQPWTVVQPAQAQALGSDAISVGLLYREDKLQLAGAAELFTTAPFDQLSRVPLTQRFRSLSGNLSFLISVNHFKSKAGCPQSQPAEAQQTDVIDSNADQGDGQGCWNAARLQSAQLLQQWLADLQGSMDEDKLLLVGDLNAYRMEQPLQALTRAGWIDLVSRFHSMPLYSYRYRGRIGTLDYALASEALLPRVAGAWYWNVNADASARRLQRWQPGSRFTDHDPVVVDLKLF